MAKQSDDSRGATVQGASPSTLKDRLGNVPAYDPRESAGATTEAASFAETMGGPLDETLPPPAEEHFEFKPIKPEELEGKVLDGKYRVIESLGEGGMGAVYRAEHITIGSQVAVKVLHPESAMQEESLTRFQREARAAATIGHANIVRVHDIGQTPEGLPYMVMDFVKGRSLASVSYHDAPIATERAIDIAVQILSALGAAHEAGIVHRDIKPENVLITEEDDGTERAMVLDFGISKFREIDPEQQSLTRTGTILGTPLYMAPEQARGQSDIDHRIDLYAVGAVLYELLTGHQPYKAENYNALIVKIMTELPPPMTDHWPYIDPDIVPVVEKAMAREREDRFSSAAEFIGALTGEAPVKTLSPGGKFGATRTKGRKILWAGVAVAVLLLGGGVAFWSSSLLDDDSEANDQQSLAPTQPDDSSPIIGGDAASQGDGSTPQTDADQGEAEFAEVEISVVPSTATLRIDGRPVEMPYRDKLPRGPQKTIHVYASARGYQPFEEEYPIDEATFSKRIELVKRSKAPSSPPRERPKKRPQKIPREMREKGFE